MATARAAVQQCRDPSPPGSLRGNSAELALDLARDLEGSHALELNSARRTWHLVTGEYPPATGGVADYTAALATALVDSGSGVHIWATGDSDTCPSKADGVTIHRLAGGFGPGGLARMDRELDEFHGPRMILIQYTPHAFGWKAMNLPFVAWALARRFRRGDDVRVMFHEVAFPWVAWPPHHNILAVVNRLMTAGLLRSSTRVYVSIPGWVPLLRRLGAGRLPIVWIPIPSNVPGDVSPDIGDERRVELTGGRPHSQVIGHFGNYGLSITRSLGPVLRTILGRREDVYILLLGVGGARWRRELIRDRAEWAGRVVAPGLLPSMTIAEYLRACDLVVQPYPDGVSSRRTTVMASLVNEIPVVTTIGHLTEPMWADGSVAAAPVGDPDRLAEMVIDLLGSPGRLAELSLAGRRLYEGRFALRHTLSALLDTSLG